MAAPVHALPPAMAAMPAPAAAPMAAPDTVPCCLGVMFVQAASVPIATPMTIDRISFMTAPSGLALRAGDDDLEPQGLDHGAVQLGGVRSVPTVQPVTYGVQGVRLQAVGEPRNQGLGVVELAPFLVRAFHLQQVGDPQQVGFLQAGV
ncbi:hypothetical protein G6F22_020000 [Rhizopus arrhizus]|nr:hypothetical protein G6F22_020000 [Rhizopus arrhizus]